MAICQALLRPLLTLDRFPGYGLSYPAGSELRIAESIPDRTPAEFSHRVLRLRAALESFDRANSVAEPRDRPIIDFLRGLVAAQIPGAAAEAALHFKEFSDYCRQIASSTNERASICETRAIAAEKEAGNIHASYSVGLGGGFIGMEKAEPLIRKSALIQEFRRFHAESVQLRAVSDDFSYMAEICGDAAVTLDSQNDAPIQKSRDL